MTDHQPHTPKTVSTGFVRDMFEIAAVYAGYSENMDAARLHFNRWHSAEIAAAEQRGAIKALRDAAQVMQDDLAWANTQRGLLVFEDESDPGISPFQWLENRADQMEGDDA